MKKLILLPFLVFGQFMANAQKPTKKAQQIITLNLMPAGPVHLPKTKIQEKGKDKDKDKILPPQEKFELSQDKNLFMAMQVIDTVFDDKNTPAKSRAVIYTLTSL